MKFPDEPMLCFFKVAAVCASIVGVGCSSSPTVDDSPVAALTEISVGNQYTVSTGSDSRGSKFTGQVTSVDRDNIVMVDPQVEGWAEKSVPVFGQIPGNHPFKASKGIGREKRLGPVTIKRADVVSVATVADKDE